MTHNIIAFVITLCIALFWLRINDYFAQKGWVSSDLSRKVIHIGTGPIFVICWLFFDKHASARYLAALIPLAISLQFFFVGAGIIKDESAVKAMSRSGDRKEILRGPLYYGIVFVCLTILFWYENPIGITALMLMCGGDGLADIVGRRYGIKKLPWNKYKSWAGSLTMFFGGWITTFIIIWIFVTAGIFPGSMTSFILSITIIAIGCTITESLPFKDIDNVTITLTAIALGYLLF
jgi:phytol kinase